MDRIEGRVAVVTGAASGIGLALANTFATAGARVVLADVEQEPLDAVVRRLRADGHRAIGVRTDVRSQREVRQLAEATMHEFGAVHILCNNAGVESGALFSDIPLSTWEWVMDVNFWGVVHGCREFLPLLRAQDEGHIVNTASMSALATESPTMTPYVCSKFAVHGLSECLDNELRVAGERIGVSVIMPGPVLTRMMDAERNRPDGAPATEAIPARRAWRDAMSHSMRDRGLQPDAVASQVLDAIQTGRFFVLPHPDRALAAVERRLRRMADSLPAEALPAEVLSAEALSTRDSTAD
jgi:NAD(P)-dependent dehydrogenase (short-subunit alcohol dehydrogenase family)